MKPTKEVRLHAIFAILFALILTSAETVRRFGEWGHWSRWADDYILGLLLIVPAILILKGNTKGRPVLIAGWGCSAGLLYGSFFSKVTATAADYQTNIDPGMLVPLIGLGFAVSCLALAWAISIEIRMQKVNNNKV